VGRGEWGVGAGGSIELGLILSHVNELRKNFSDVELKILRGTGPQIVEYLKAGDAELAVGTSIGEIWDRLDTWKLFDESFDMVFSRTHRLGSQEAISLDDLKPERFLLRSHCEKCTDLAAMLRAKGLNADHRHEVSSDQDLLALLEANIGIGFLPRTVNAPQRCLRLSLLLPVLFFILPAMAYAQSGSPFDTGLTSIQTLFTGTIAKVASLIAIVIGGYQFAHGEPGAKKSLAGVAAGTGIAVLATNVLSWLWGA